MTRQSTGVAAIFIFEEKLISTPITNNYCKHVDYERANGFIPHLSRQFRSDKMSLDASLLIRPTYPKTFGESIAFFSSQVSWSFLVCMLVSKCVIFLFIFFLCLCCTGLGEILAAEMRNRIMVLHGRCYGHDDSVLLPHRRAVQRSLSTPQFLPHVLILSLAIVTIWSHFVHTLPVNVLFVSTSLLIVSSLEILWSRSWFCRNQHLQWNQCIPGWLWDRASGEGLSLTHSQMQSQFLQL